MTIQDKLLLGTFAYPTKLSDNISVQECSPSRDFPKSFPGDIQVAPKAAVVKKSQPAVKHSASSNVLSPLEVTILKNVGEAHALGISLDKEHLCKLSGYNHPSTKMYAKAFKGCKDKHMMFVQKNLVGFTAEGLSTLQGRGELPSPPGSNEETMDRINAMLQKLGLEQTGFDILNVLVKRHSETLPNLSKNELALAVGKAPTTKSFSKSVTFLLSFGVLERSSGKHSITKVYAPFNEKE
ncbi:MAG: hypothetical protein SGILL_004831 [Bacillariaceae sp.]